MRPAPAALIVVLCVSTARAQPSGGDGLPPPVAPPARSARPALVVRQVGRTPGETAAFDAEAKQAAGYLRARGFAPTVVTGDTWPHVTEALERAGARGAAFGRVVLVGRGGWDGPILAGGAQASPELDPATFERLARALRAGTTEDARVVVSSSHAGGSNRFEAAEGGRKLRWVDALAAATGRVVVGPAGLASSAATLPLLRLAEGEGAADQETRVARAARAATVRDAERVPASVLTPTTSAPTTSVPTRPAPPAAAHAAGGAAGAPAVSAGHGLVALLAGEPGGASETSPAALRRLEVNGSIAQAVALERAGRHEEALAAFRAAVFLSPEDPKARYFLGKHYAELARRASDPAQEREYRRLSRLHLSTVEGFADRVPSAPVERVGPFAGMTEDAWWATQARARLREGALGTPRLDQHASGSYPWGYCAPTSLRMALRLEGLGDPGADAVALHGSAPYSPGAGSSGAALAARARELGLPKARFATTSSLAGVAASIEGGHPVLVGGEGSYSATLDDGGRKARAYPAGHWLLAVDVHRDAAGAVRDVVLNDPDGGHRVTMTRGEFERFFGGPGSVFTVRYD